jgi:hypothetical protein
MRPKPAWGFLTNHFYVLHSIASDPERTLREIAGRVGITERAVQRIVAELEDGGFLVRQREGRRNRYVLREGAPRHELDVSLALGELLGLDGSPRVGLRDATPRNASFID